ncbi:hypothetical protein BD626DRAFT_576229 [Schizophyllum amplum]|uniref:Uncharacterized protein n=1 Tax=Schizophyllum amplum TaxID=97359 RepID=A0A550BTZ1_9AGAR|nr:hypothetical protein BD626DRAFT_576229 [Auriculariopsis ampla]
MPSPSTTRPLASYNVCGPISPAPSQRERFSPAPSQRERISPAPSERERIHDAHLTRIHDAHLTRIHNTDDGYLIRTVLERERIHDAHLISTNITIRISSERERFSFAPSSSGSAYTMPISSAPSALAHGRGGRIRRHGCGDGASYSRTPLNPYPS